MSYSGSDNLEPLLALEYELRFAKNAAYRQKVWSELIKSFFQRYVPPAASVLDLGCGWGEFINTVQAGRKYAMDLNPDAAKHLAANTDFYLQDCSSTWPLADGSLDIVFTSNFFEHLPSKEKLVSTVTEARRCLRNGGLLICMGPNIRYLAGAYWDFFDHYLPLSDASMEELARLCGFREVQVIKKFLPYTMARGPQPPVFFLRWYLRLPFLWKIAGKQFLIIAKK
jgi:SAM-dependent methyltransferase